MDREKLNKVAIEFDSKEEYGTLGVCFIKGAEWLMQQPLSERLNDAEKEKIRKFYKTVWGKSVNKVQLELTDIFGADLFKE